MKLEPVTQHGDYTTCPFQSQIDLQAGRVIEGTIPVPAIDAEQLGMFFEVEVSRVTNHVWLAVLISRGGKLNTGIFDTLDDTFEYLDEVSRPHPCGKTGCLRLLVRGGLVEIYLANVLLQCVTMPFTPTGKLGFLSRQLVLPENSLFNAFTTWTMKKNY